MIAPMTAIWRPAVSAAWARRARNSVPDTFSSVFMANNARPAKIATLAAYWGVLPAWKMRSSRIAKGTAKKSAVVITSRAAGRSSAATGLRSKRVAKALMPSHTVAK